MPAAIRLSVALVTRNRPESLERCLDSLHTQERAPDMIVISDDSDREEAMRGNRSIARRFGCDYITGPRNGLYANRNHAFAACRGTHIRTMDDDHEFPPGHIAACYDAIASDPGAVWVIGEHYPSTPPERRVPPPPVPGQLRPRGYSSAPRPGESYWGLSDGASIFPASVLEAGIRYYEGFQFGASYLELGARLHHLGYRLKFLPATFVLHHYDPNRRSFMDPDIDTTSMYFAMLCFSFRYQPKLANQLATLGRFLLDVCRHPKPACRRLSTATSHFRGFHATPRLATPDRSA